MCVCVGSWLVRSALRRLGLFLPIAPLLILQIFLVLLLDGSVFLQVFRPLLGFISLVAAVADVSVLVVLRGAHQRLLGGGMLLVAAETGDFLRWIRGIGHAGYRMTGEGMPDLRRVRGENFGDFTEIGSGDFLRSEQRDLVALDGAVGVAGQAQGVSFRACLLGKIAAVRIMAGGALSLLVRLVQNLFLTLIVAGEAELVLGRDQFHGRRVAGRLYAVAGAAAHLYGGVHRLALGLVVVTFQAVFVLHIFGQRHRVFGGGHRQAACQDQQEEEP